MMGSGATQIQWSLTVSNSQPSPLGQSLSSRQASFAVWQKYSTCQWVCADDVGEQKPPGPQSASTAQSLPVRQTLAPLSVAEGRHAHGTCAGQFESLKHVS
jgi:hypothetical protein